MAEVSVMQRFGSASTQAGATVGGAILAGFARKKISFLDTTVGKALIIIIGLLVVSYSKSDTLKGVGVGIATNGALGFASSLGLSGVDGLGSVGEQMGAIVQDENGMVYMVNGVGDEYMPYEIPVIAGLTQGTGGFGAADDVARF